MPPPSLPSTIAEAGAWLRHGQISSVGLTQALLDRSRAALELREQSLAEVGWGLRRRLDAAAVLVTRGRDGMSLFEQGGRYTYLPTAARNVYDVTGAGDTVVSVVALALATRADFPTACHLSNHAAGVVVGEVGTAACTPERLLHSLEDKHP